MYLLLASILLGIKLKYLFWIVVIILVGVAIVSGIAGALVWVITYWIIVLVVRIFTGKQIDHFKSSPEELSGDKRAHHEEVSSTVDTISTISLLLGILTFLIVFFFIGRALVISS